MIKVILKLNTHRDDYWSETELTTWAIAVDDGTEEGGKMLAEFRDREVSILFCSLMGWTIARS